MGSLNESVRKKYDSTNLHPKMRHQRRIEAARGPAAKEKGRRKEGGEREESAD